MKILQDCKSILERKETMDILVELLKHKDATRKPKLADGVMKVLCYILTEGLLENGYVENLETVKLANELNVGQTTVRKFLKTFGFSYNKDRVTKQEDQSKSLGYIERYFKTEYTDDKCIKTRTSKSVFTIVATKDFYNRLRELNVEDFTELTDMELQKLHNQFKNASYRKTTTIEPSNIVVQTEHIEDYNGNIISHTEKLIDLQNSIVLSAHNYLHKEDISPLDRMNNIAIKHQLSGENQQKLHKNDENLDKNDQKLEKLDQNYTKIDKNKEDHKQYTISDEEKEERKKLLGISNKRRAIPNR